MSAGRWKSLRAFAKYALAVVVVVLVTLGYWLYRHPLVSCSTFEATMLKARMGYSVILSQQLCDGMASSDTMSVELDEPSGRRTVVFEFEAAHSFVRNGQSADPRVVWEDPKTLKISVDKIASVKTKLDKADDIHIVYDIGDIIYR